MDRSLSVLLDSGNVTEQGSAQRLETPTRSHPARRRSPPQAVPAPAAPLGGEQVGATGMKPFLADFYNKGIENLTLVAELAKWNASLKERWALAALEKDVAQPEAWIGGCVRKQQAQQRYNNMSFGRATAPAPEALVARPQTAQPWVAGVTAPQVLAPAPPPAPVRLSTAPPSPGGEQVGATSMKPFLADFYNEGVENLILVAELAKWNASLEETWALAALEKDVAQP